MPNTDGFTLTPVERSIKYNNGIWTEDKQLCECGEKYNPKTISNRYGTKRVCDNPECDVQGVFYNPKGEIVRIIRSAVL